jgi:hypothetical protein
MDQEKSLQKQQISRTKRNSVVSNKLRLELVKLVMIDGELIKEVEQKLMNSTFFTNIGRVIFVMCPLQMLVHTRHLTTSSTSNKFTLISCR